MANQSGVHAFVTLVLLVAVCILGYLWISGPRSDVAIEKRDGDGNGLLKTDVEFREKLAELRMQKYKVQKGVKRLETLKAETVEHLNSKGIKSGEDYLKSTDADVKYAVKNLQGWVAQIDKINQEVAYYDEAILGVENMLDKIERERIDESVSLTRQEYLDLQKIIIDLNERLEVETNILEDEELGKLLDLEMTKPAKE